MRWRRVVVSGSSISMIVRPQSPSSASYPALLEERLNAVAPVPWLVDNRSRIAATCSDLVKDAPAIVAARPDVIILHHGYNEALNRPHRRSVWMFEHMHRPRSGPAVAAARYASIKVSRVRSMLRLTEHWVGPREFAAALDWTLRYLALETGAHIITLGITPWSAQLTRYAPGSDAAIAEFDDILKRASGAHGAAYLSFNELTRGLDVAQAIPDGTHFSTGGHRVVAARLAALIEEGRA